MNAGASGMTTGWSITVEVLVLGLDDDGAVRVQHRTAPLHPPARPDDLALSLSGVAAAPGAVSHSTSWRYDAPGELVLTYTALPGADGLGEVVAHPSVVTSLDPLHPQPEHLHAHHVVAHAVLHLVALSRRDPGTAPSRGLHTTLWAALDQLSCQTPTGPHEQTHLLAAHRAR